MKKTLTAVLAAALIAATLAGTATDAPAQWRAPGWGGRGPGWGWRCPGWGWGPGVAAGVVGGAIIAGAILASRPAGYVVYPGYAQPVHALNQFLTLGVASSAIRASPCRSVLATQVHHPLLSQHRRLRCRRNDADSFAS